MRIVFAGTPDFAQRALAALIDAAPSRGWTLPLVLSQPDRPAGRGMKLTASPVKALAQSHGIEVATPPTLSVKRGGAAAEAAQAQLRDAAADVLVVAAYGLILPQAVLDAPRGLVQAGGARLTALNIHASLLPRWRGAAPITRAIEAGDAETGITIMQMEAGLDTGPMLLAAREPITPTDTSATLTQRLGDLGARLIVQALDAAARGALVPRLQPADGPEITYAHKLGKDEAALDLRQPAALLARQVRAFDPYPVATLVWRGAPLRVWRAHAAAAGTVRPAAPPGTVVAVGADGVHVATGDGVLVLLELQRAGGKRLPAREFLAGAPIAVGDILGGRAAPAAA
jgi:methionyl-tRNA formyltransferase